MPESLILASSSGIRRRLLQQAGVAVTCLPHAVDEDSLKEMYLAKGLSCKEIALGLAHEKALSLSSQEALILGCDQVLESEGRLFSKPSSRTEAKAHLLKLRGRTHALHCGLALVRKKETLWSFSETSFLTVRSFSDSFLEAYLEAAGEALCETVGGYHMEGLGVQLFENVEGSFFSICGLPLLPLLKALRREGALLA